MTQSLKIMAAVDMSDFSPTTVRYSMWLAMKLNADLLMVSVINQRDLDMVHRSMVGYEGFSYSNYLSDQVQDRERKMKELFEAASPSQVNCRYIVKNGIPYRELLTAIEEEKPDLLVLSTKGRSNLADVMIGSTARKMYHRSPIPLISVPAAYSDFP